MPSARGIVIGLVVGILVGAYFELWLHLPTFLSVAIAAFIGMVFVMVATWLGGDPAAADAAWRARAGDLVGSLTDDAPVAALDERPDAKPARPADD